MPALITLTGPMLVGYFLAWGLYGVLSTQVYMYAQAFSRDGPSIKILVYSIYLIQTAQIILYTDSGFQGFAAGFGDFNSINQVRTVWFSVVLIEGIVAFAVQSFYSWRIYIISGRRLPTVMISLMSLVSFVSSIIVAINTKAQGQFTKILTRNVLIEAGIWEASAALCDVMIAGCMTYYLKRRAPEGSGGQFARTAAVINRIIRLTIETGSLTASVAIITLALTFLPGRPGYYTCSLTILSGLYATTLLAVLNSRINFRVTSHATTWRDGQSEQSELPMRHIIKGNLSQGSNAFSGTDHHKVMVRVTQEELVRGDLDYNLTQEQSFNEHKAIKSGISNE